MAKSKFDFDVIAIGAGFAGLSLIHHVRKAGLSIRVFDKAAGIGGTWAWNRYPGAATDSESYVYCLTFSEELLKEWTWSERYPGWEETQRYFQFVADKFDMRPHIQLDTEIAAAEYQEGLGGWRIRTAAGQTFTCKYFVSAMGLMSEPVMPDIDGVDRFAGPIFHSARWPKGLQYAGKKIGIVGAGATAVQMLPVMAETAESVTLFQRTPNYVLPAVQKKITEQWDSEIKANYPEILEKCRGHVFGLPYDSPVNRTIADTPPAEVQEILEAHWPRGSFSFFFETFDDLLTNPESNQVVVDFLARKIREKVDDPKLAELLTPKGYPLFGKRPPLDHGYYESFNRDNVQLVDVKHHEPIVEITEEGIRTTEKSYPFDMIVLATGFQAYTGALEAMDITGLNNLRLKDKWADESASILGVFVSGFPNMFMVTGPHAPFSNLPPVIEQSVEYIVGCISSMERDQHDVFEPRRTAEQEWVQHSTEVHSYTVMNEAAKTNSWIMGTNLVGRKPRVLAYVGGANVYFERLRASSAAGFPELEASSIQS